MTAPNQPEPIGPPVAPALPADPALDELRDLLFEGYRRRVVELEEEVDTLRARLADHREIAAMIEPSMADVVRRRIVEAREEMVEALYPIIGPLVARAVSEAIRDLQRVVDARLKATLQGPTLFRRLQARLSGVSEAELALRDALPFQVAEVFLVHRHTGLLLWHASQTPDDEADSDVVGGMLTAIQDFVHDIFGQDREGQLDEIQYGQQRILIEASKYAYLAVVVDGVEPAGFRQQVRDALLRYTQQNAAALRDFQGDVTSVVPDSETVQAVTAAGSPEAAPSLSRGQARAFALVAGLLLLCLASACLAGVWAWRVSQAVFAPAPPPTPVAIATAATADTPTATATTTTVAPPAFTATAATDPTAIPEPTSTPTAEPTATATAIPSPTPTETRTVQVSNVNLNVRAAPASQGALLGTLGPGTILDLLEVSGDGNWFSVCCLTDGRSGWVAAGFVVDRQ